MYNGLKKPKSVLDSNLFRGVTDFSNLSQFNLYESGYQVLLAIQFPLFMEKLAELNEEYAYIIDNYKAILEKEFKNLEGLEDLTVDTLELSDGINTLNMISKVNEPTAVTVNMTFTEKSGLTITKYHELYLKGVKDPKAKQAKHYHGLIANGTLEADWANEVGIFLYIITDNTYRQVERAYLLLAAYPNNAETSMFNGTVGEIDKKDITVSYNVFPVTGEAVYMKAAEALAWLLNTEQNPDAMIINSDNYHWKALDKVKVSG